MSLSDPAIFDASQSSAIHHHSPYTPSSPIEIPNRRRAIPSVINFSPITSMSPDLVFEMSPVTSSFSPPQYTFGFPDSTQNAKAQDPFLYTFPRFSIQRTSSSGNQVRPLKTRSVGSCSRFTSSTPTKCQPDNVSSPPPVGRAFNRITSTVWVAPLNPMLTQGHSPIRPPQNIPLSPALGNPTYATTPWIIPKRAEVFNEDLSLDTDTIPVDFEHYLMRRIEDQTRMRSQGAPFMANLRR